jgi:hypothetical protein
MFRFTRVAHPDTDVLAYSSNLNTRLGYGCFGHLLGLFSVGFGLWGYLESGSLFPLVICLVLALVVIWMLCIQISSFIVDKRHRLVIRHYVLCGLWSWPKHYSLDQFTRVHVDDDGPISEGPRYSVNLLAEERDGVLFPKLKSKLLLGSYVDYGAAMQAADEISSFLRLPNS